MLNEDILAAKGDICCSYTPNWKSPDHLYTPKFLSIYPTGKEAKIVIIVNTEEEKYSYMILDSKTAYVVALHLLGSIYQDKGFSEHDLALINSDLLNL